MADEEEIRKDLIMKGIKKAAPAIKSSKFNPIKYVALDTETSGLRVWHKDMPFAVSMCDDSGETFYCEWPVDPNTREVTPDMDDIAFIQKYMGPEYEHVFHNRKFDCRMLSKVGVTVMGESHDTAVSARVMYSLEMSYGLKTLSKKYLGIQDEDEKALAALVQSCRRKAQGFNRRAKKVPGTPLISLGEEYQQDYWLPRWFDPNDRTCEKYATLDAVRTMGLFLFHMQVFEEDPLLAAGYEDERELFPEVDRIEARGMCIDLARVKEEYDRAKIALVEHMAEMHKIILEKDLQPWDIEKLTKIHTDKVYAMSQKIGKRALQTVPDLVLPCVTDSKEDGGFNPESPPQLQRVLYMPVGQGGLGLTTHRKTKTGMSTDKFALRELMSEPFIRHLIAYRSAGQAISLFFEKYDKLKVHEGNGVWALHPGVNQTGTVTFRMSSNDPNLQQVGSPKKAGLSLGGYQIRSIFVPRPGYNLFSMDYAQQELRIFASVGQIPFLLQEILAGRDPNSSTANRAWGGKSNPAAIKAACAALEFNREEPTTDLVAAVWENYGWDAQCSERFGMYSYQSATIADEWLSEFNYDIVKAEKSLDKSPSRGRSKCVTFAKIYGGGASSVTELLYCTLKEAKGFLDEFDTNLPEINEYMRATTKQARLDGFVMNPYGRKIRVDPEFAYRSVNYIVQSTAAIMLKDSIKKCAKYLRSTGLDAHVLLPVHDELLYEIKKEHSYKWLLRGLADIMEDTEGRMTVPMIVECEKKLGNWNEKEVVDLSYD